jgi:hypothetical protein
MPGRLQLAVVEELLCWRGLTDGIRCLAFLPQVHSVPVLSYERYSSLVNSFYQSGLFGVDEIMAVPSNQKSAGRL